MVHYCGVSLSYAAILGSPKASFWKRNFNILCDVGLKKIAHVHGLCDFTPARDTQVEIGSLCLKDCTYHKIKTGS